MKESPTVITNKSGMPIATYNITELPIGGCCIAVVWGIPPHIQSRIVDGINYAQACDIAAIVEGVARAN